MSGTVRAGTGGRSGEWPGIAGQGSRVCRSARQPKSRASCRSSMSSARPSPSRRRAPRSRGCAPSMVRRRPRSWSPRPARAGTASAAAWAATSSASSCSATARPSRRRSARSPRRPASRSMSGPSARTPAERASARCSTPAIAFYHAVLTGSKAGERRARLPQGRGFTDETIETYQLGWAPAGWDTMTRQLHAKRDIRDEELVEVGLASPSQRGRGVYRQVPRPGHLPDPRPERPRGRPRRPAAGRGGAQVPQLPGDAAVRQEPDALPHRQGQGTHPQDAARPSSSRATRTP